MARQVYNDLIDYDKVKLINESLGKSIDFYKANEVIYLKEITELKDSNTDLTQALVKAEGSSTWNKVGYFALGLLTSGLMFYAAQRR